MILAVLWLSTPGLAQDANTLLLLRFEGSLNGEQGETPSQSSGHSFQTGIQGPGVLLPDPNYLTYPSVENISATEGTIEFWIKPTQYNNNGQSRVILSWGGSGGFYIQTDGEGNFGFTLNRYGQFSGGEKGIAASVNPLPANEWHHIAFTYSNNEKKIRSFVNGAQQQEIPFTGDLPAVSGEEFQLGGEGYQNHNVQAAMDELHISGIARSPQQIAERYASALTITGLNAVPNTMQRLPIWWETPNLQVQTHIGTRTLPNPAANWTSSNPAVATFDANRGKIIAHAAGTATVTASYNGFSADITVNVTTVGQINPHLSTTPTNALWEMPVVIIN